MSASNSPISDSQVDEHPLVREGISKPPTVRRHG
jgi:hypothetical protein